MVTIQDVAREAGVSTGTVSNVLNNSDKVSPTTRKKVEDVIYRLNYRPNSTAQSFRRCQTGILGIILPHEYPNSISPTLLGAVQEAVNYNQSILVSPPFITPEEELASIAYLSSKQIDALLYEPRNAHLNLSYMRCLEGLPLVGMMRRNLGLDVPKVYTDYKQCGYLATKYLLSLGRRNIAFIAGGNSYCDEISTEPALRALAHSTQAGLYISDDRFLGYEAALEEFGVPYDPNLVFFGSLSESGGKKVAQQLLAVGQIDGIVADNNYSAMGIIRVLTGQGTRVPEDISIVGFDDDDIGIALTPSLTTVSHSFQALGTEAVRLANRLLSGESPIEDVVLQPTLVIRESTTRKSI